MSDPTNSDPERGADWPIEEPKTCSLCGAHNLTVRRQVGRPGPALFLCVHCREAR